MGESDFVDCALIRTADGVPMQSDHLGNDIEYGSGDGR